MTGQAESSQMAFTAMLRQDTSSGAAFLAVTGQAGSQVKLPLFI